MSAAGTNSSYMVDRDSSQPTVRGNGDDGFPALPTFPANGPHVPLATTLHFQVGGDHRC